MPKYIRNKNSIKTVDDNGYAMTLDTYPSINAAKRESRKIQLAGKGLGRGDVSVEDRRNR